MIGPDEYHETIDDNAFTNVMARWNIRRALETVALLRQKWPERWASLASAIGLDDTEITQWSNVADTMATGLYLSTGLFEQFAGFFTLEPIDLASYAGRSVPMDVVLGRGAHPNGAGHQTGGRRGALGFAAGRVRGRRRGRELRLL